MIWSRGFFGMRAIEMINMPRPRKKSRRGSRLLVTVTGNDGARRGCHHQDQSASALFPIPIGRHCSTERCHLYLPTATRSAALESPCINICQLDDDTGICEGCGRTGDEIAGWITYSRTERHAIMATLKDRLVRISRRLETTK